ncbi:MAG: YkvA family protein [Marinirhabdus sp.]|nr:YkvA family protein [Marinirhabdus sp.]
MSLKGILKRVYTNQDNRNSGVDKEKFKEEVDSVTDADVEVLVDNEAHIAKKFSGSNGLTKYAELSKIMMAMVKDMRAGVYRNIPWFTIATIAVVLLYALNPMDIIPDFIPGVGYIDDIAVLSLGVGWIESDLHRYLDWKIEQGKGI